MNVAVLVALLLIAGYDAPAFAVGQESKNTEANLILSNSNSVATSNKKAVVRPIREFPFDPLNPPSQAAKIDICFGCVQKPGDYICYFSIRSPKSVSNVTLKAMEVHRMNSVNPTDTHLCLGRSWVAGEGSIIDGRCPLQYPVASFKCK